MRRSIAVLALSVACVMPVAAQQPVQSPLQAPADPEIYLLSVSINDGRIALGKPTNITNRPGYDNQPAFSPSGRDIFYTSTREDAQADIYRYNIETGKSERVTMTAPESEYSATVMPSRERLSIVRVEKDSTQRLWSFAIGTTNERLGVDDRLVLPDMKPVGYHAWIDPSHVVLFVLGTPNSLVLANLQTGTREVLAHNIGRSLVPLPSGHGFTFLSRHDSAWVLTEMRLDRSNDSVRLARPLVTLPEGMDFVAWLGGTLLGGSGSKLLKWTPGGEWTEVADLSGQGLTHITRIAVSPTGKALAIVAEAGPVKP